MMREYESDHAVEFQYGVQTADKESAEGIEIVKILDYNLVIVGLQSVMLL